MYDLRPEKDPDEIVAMNPLKKARKPTKARNSAQF
jgi:hypothetical protein